MLILNIMFHVVSGANENRYLPSNLPASVSDKSQYPLLINFTSLKAELNAINLLLNEQ